MQLKIIYVNKIHSLIFFSIYPIQCHNILTVIGQELRDILDKSQDQHRETDN